MKSLILLSSLLLLASCGKELFGTAAQNSLDKAPGVDKYIATFQTKNTITKPKVDILYVVDNSGSTYSLQASFKASVKKTIETISNDFDYRVISIPLISNSMTPYVYTKSSEALPSTSYIVPSADALIDPIFSNIVIDTERGLQRTIDFMNHHTNTGLFRNGAYHLIVLVSNGHDEEVEEVWEENGETRLRKTTSNPIVTEYSKRLSQFNQLKINLASKQLRLFSATASSVCNGWRSSKISYQAMSKKLYQDSGATDSLTEDVYDICGNGLSNLFAGVNQSIQKVVIPHSYRYFPVTFADTHNFVDTNNIQVKKISNGNITQLTRNTDWTLESSSTAVSKATRELPSPGEYQSAKHFVKVTTLITYPDDIIISSTSYLEYFGYIVLPKPARNDGSIVVKVNGQELPKSSYSYEGFKANTDTKVSYQGSKIEPAVKKTGYFIKITNSAFFYKSGDDVEVFYTPAPI